MNLLGLCTLKRYNAGGNNTLTHHMLLTRP